MPNDEWCTPPEIIDCVKKVFDIQLDPCANEFSDSIIKPLRSYTKGKNGLDYYWTGNIFINPPYSRGLINQFIIHLNTCVETGFELQYILLVNNDTDTKWFHEIFNTAYAMCILDKRIKFLKPDGSKGSSPRQGQIIFYRGCRKGLFYDVFEKLGRVILL